jgi:hypothetical protein
MPSNQFEISGCVREILRLARKFIGLRKSLLIALTPCLEFRQIALTLGLLSEFLASFKARRVFHILRIPLAAGIGVRVGFGVVQSRLCDGLLRLWLRTHAHATIGFNFRFCACSTDFRFARSLGVIRETLVQPAMLRRFRPIAGVGLLTFAFTFRGLLDIRHTGAIDRGSNDALLKFSRGGLRRRIFRGDCCYLLHLICSHHPRAPCRHGLWRYAFECGGGRIRAERQIGERPWTLRAGHWALWRHRAARRHAGGHSWRRAARAHRRGSWATWRRTHRRHARHARRRTTGAHLD